MWIRIEGKEPGALLQGGKGGVGYRVVTICISYIDSLVKHGPKGFNPSTLSHPFAQMTHTIGINTSAALDSGD